MVPTRIVQRVIHVLTAIAFSIIVNANRMAIVQRATVAVDASVSLITIFSHVRATQIVPRGTNATATFATLTTVARMMRSVLTERLVSVVSVFLGAMRNLLVHLGFSALTDSAPIPALTTRNAQTVRSAWADFVFTAAGALRTAQVATNAVMVFASLSSSPVMGTTIATARSSA